MLTGVIVCVGECVDNANMTTMNSITWIYASSSYIYDSMT